MPIMTMFITQGLYSLRRHHVIDIGIPFINLGWRPDQFSFITGIAVPERQGLFNK